MIQAFAVDGRNPFAKGLAEKERELEKILVCKSSVQSFCFKLHV
jgi:hypothetical protein